MTKTAGVRPTIALEDHKLISGALRVAAFHATWGRWPHRASQLPGEAQAARHLRAIHHAPRSHALDRVLVALLGDEGLMEDAIRNRQEQPEAYWKLRSEAPRLLSFCRKLDALLALQAQLGDWPRADNKDETIRSSARFHKRLRGVMDPDRIVEVAKRDIDLAHWALSGHENAARKTLLARFGAGTAGLTSSRPQSCASGQACWCRALSSVESDRRGGRPRAQSRDASPADSTGWLAGLFD